MKIINAIKSAWQCVCRHTKLVLGIGAAVLAPAAAHATAPSTLDDFVTIATGYITTGTTVAVAAATLGIGWVGYRIAKKFTKGAMST